MNTYINILTIQLPSANGKREKKTFFSTFSLLEKNVCLYRCLYVVPKTLRREWREETERKECTNNTSSVSVSDVVFPATPLINFKSGNQEAQIWGVFERRVVLILGSKHPKQSRPVCHALFWA